VSPEGGVFLQGGAFYANHFGSRGSTSFLSWLGENLGCRPAKGHSKKKVTDPYVVGWFLRGQKSTRAGQIFFRDFFILFLNSPHQETPKNVIKKNREKIGLGFFVDFFVKTFRQDFFVKRFL
jgi:hypothetical protein